MTLTMAYESATQRTGRVGHLYYAVCGRGGHVAHGAALAHHAPVCRVHPRSLRGRSRRGSGRAGSEVAPPRQRVLTNSDIGQKLVSKPLDNVHTLGIMWVHCR